MIGLLWISRQVFIGDDSELCTARLLYPQIDRLDGRGSLLSGKELAGEIQRLGPENTNVACAVRPEHDAKGHWKLAVAGDVEVKKRLTGRRFSTGN